MAQPREGDGTQGTSPRQSSSSPTMLKALLREQHLQNYGMFKRAYQKTAQALDKNLIGTYPSEPTFRRWLAGRIKYLPRAEHCAVLEAMLPGWTATELFQPQAPPQGLTTINTTYAERSGNFTKIVGNSENDTEIPIDGTQGDSNGGSATPPSTRSSATSSRAREPRNGLDSVLLEAADESTDFLTWAEATNVGDLTVEQIHGEIHGIARSYLKVPTLPLFERARRLRDRSFSLLSGRQKPTHSRDLYSAAGWSLTILAWISTDLGRPGAAEEHLRTAWLCAENADHNGLRAWVRAAQHTAAFWQRDFARAGQHAEDGLRYAATGSAKLFLTSALALDMVRCGDREGAQRGLAHARGVADRLSGHGDELSGPFTCSADRAGGFWSDTQLSLGEAADALSAANDAIFAFETTPSDLRNVGSERMVRCQQVKAHLILDELDGAWESLAPVLDTAPEHRVQPLAQRVREISDLVSSSRWRGAPIVGQIQQAISDFQENQPTRPLP